VPVASKEVVGVTIMPGTFGAPSIFRTEMLLMLLKNGKLSKRSQSTSSSGPPKLAKAGEVFAL
jgi:hypothetical protein